MPPTPTPATAFDPRSVRRSGYLKIYFGQEDSYVVYEQEITENRYK